MALNSRERRSSVVSLYPGAPPSVTPIATPDQEWRQEAGWAYSGILVGDVAAPPIFLGGEFFTSVPEAGSFEILHDVTGEFLTSALESGNFEILYDAAGEFIIAVPLRGEE